MAKQKLIYEWVFEAVDGDGDIIDCDYFTKAGDAMAYGEGKEGRIAICKRYIGFQGYPGDEADEGLWDEEGRTYSYDGVEFEDGTTVPPRMQDKFKSFVPHSKER